MVGFALSRTRPSGGVLLPSFFLFVCVCLQPTLPHVVPQARVRRCENSSFSFLLLRVVLHYAFADQAARSESTSRFRLRCTGAGAWCSSKCLFFFSSFLFPPCPSIQLASCARTDVERKENPPKKERKKKVESRPRTARSSDLVTYMRRNNEIRAGWGVRGRNCCSAMNSKASLENPTPSSTTAAAAQPDDRNSTPRCV